jgi:hypothetical protein
MTAGQRCWAVPVEVRRSRTGGGVRPGGTSDYGRREAARPGPSTDVGGPGTRDLRRRLVVHEETSADIVRGVREASLADMGCSHGQGGGPLAVVEWAGDLPAA